MTTTSTPTDPAPLADAYREGMRTLAAGVCLITSAHGGEHGGMVATAVTSVSAEPPTLLVCVNRSASLFEMVKSSGRFCVNVLGRQAVPLVDVFSSSARRAERFQSGEWSSTTSGIRVSGEALAAFECEVAEAIEWHSHVIFLGRVVGVSHPRAEAGTHAPLLYMDRKFHQLAEIAAAVA